MNYCETTSSFETWDGESLFYRHWVPENPGTQAVILLHRGHEHSGRVEDLLQQLSLDGFQGFAYDMRGHGRSPGDRGYAKDYDTWVKDLNSFITYVRDHHGIATENMALVANSVGAVNAATWVHDYGVPIRCMVLAAPAFSINLYVPLAIPGLRILNKVKEKSFVKSYVRSSMLTQDKDQAQLYDNDELVTRNISVSVLLGLHDTAKRIVEDAGAIHTPTMILSAGKDFVVRTKVQREFFDRLSSAKKEFCDFPDKRHAILYETDRKEIIGKARNFILSCFETSLDYRELIHADKGGYTLNEYVSLQKPASLMKRLQFGSQVVSMKTLGQCSKGISIGLKHGFDSGKSLDHVYLDRAEGTAVIGKVIDRTYLDAIGWKGIRMRKENIQHWIELAIQDLRNEGQPIHIMDIASGPGRYLLELKHREPNIESLLLRDNTEENLEAARRQAGEFELEGVTTEKADAFSASSYKTISPRPTIAVISGLFELFPDNKQILTALRGVHESLAPGGYLVYTGQPWHPQIEMIARTLTNRDGKPWIMRRRTQQELNVLVAEAGFQRLDSRIDSFGIFTVTLARKEKN